MEGTRLIPRTPSAYAYPLLIKQLLHTPLLYAPDEEIVYRELVRHTYRDFYARINRLASALTSLGVRPGDTVAVLDWDSHRYLECFYAVPMLGAVLHTVNIRLSPEQILFTMNHAEDTVVLAHQDFLPLLEGIASKLETVQTFILLLDDSERPPTSLPLTAEYEEMLKRADDSFDFPDFEEDTQATVFYTTGTTGDPKGVYFSHRQLVLHTLAAGMMLGCFREPRFQSGDVYMPITPMFHVHAWGIPYVATLLGVKQVYPGLYEAGKLLKLIEKEKVTFSHCVPTLLHMILSDPMASKVDLNGWKVNIGGSALSKGLARAAMERGVKLIAGYGMSETCPILTAALLKPFMLDWDIERRLDVQRKAGFPIPLVDLRVVDETGDPLPRDGSSAGEIVVRSPWLTQGYFKEPQKSEELWRGGWLHTGDIATIDQEGYVQITDRLKDVIKSGGEWISSLEIESLMSQHEAVSEVAVVGINDERWGERPIAVVVPKLGSKARASEEDLRAFLDKFVNEGLISKWSVPDRIYLVNEIPKTSVGKMDKKEVKKQFEKK
ncbi:MAG: fatty acid--CoA ligase [Deltaproteobacteria bacterium]|nr:fatty acid--CoA ligase [Deltaproteobacteria bacterium]MBW2085030.1 fatty acid--CoA ligase [Deltaproteobacteria bacterium]